MPVQNTYNLLSLPDKTNYRYPPL